MKDLRNIIRPRATVSSVKHERSGALLNQHNHSFLNIKQKLIDWIIRLIRSDFKWLGRFLLKGSRLAWRNRTGPTEGNPKESTTSPTGPYATEHKHKMGDILLWVPHRINSFIIDDLTGRYGYSHITVDTGEVDLPSGKPVMIEANVAQPVELVFQDKYKNRAYARIPLSKIGADAEAFVACVKSRLGEPYDTLEALTLGEIDDPAKQICSSLVSECIPETLRRKIAKARRLGLLRGASVSVQSPRNAPITKTFISPNGFAHYFGAPRGEKLDGTNFLVEPHPLDVSIQAAVRVLSWKAAVVLGAAGALAVGILLIIRKNDELEIS